MLNSYDDLPAGIKKNIEKVIGGDVASWVHRSIPALHNKSIMEVMNSSGGELEVRAYLQRVESDSF